ncbi:MAG: hypothetical protein ABI432_01545 [Flavobacteriales bacterium]
MGLRAAFRAGLRGLVLLALILPACSFGQARSILDRDVEVYATNVRLSEALSLIAREGDFKLSYNAAAVNGDSLVSVTANGTVHQALHGLLGERMELKESGSHIILLDRSGAKHRFRVNGSVVDAVSGAPVSRASVYEVQQSNASVTDGNGAFDLEVSGQRARTALLIMRKEYHDTVVYVGRDGDLGRVALQPRSKLEYLEPICTFDRCEVEDLGVARLLVPASQQDQAANFMFVERRTFQASLWPTVGTNKEISGAVVNQFSLNLLAGYARGLEGFEVGAGVNMERSYVKGAQVAGLANLVGGDTKGVQIAGGLNHTMRSLEGLQIAGLGNTVWDTLSGVQIAGGANVVKGGMRGTQVAGLCNVTTQDVNGVQVAGGVNVAVKDVHKTQIAGAVNYGRNVSGAQAVGGVNVALGAVGGGQIAGAINYARDVTGGQIAGGINFAVDTVRGGQVGVLNFARVVKGGQVGILNFSDTITGAAVGILSFAWHGYHRFDLSYTDVLPLTLTFRTGTRQFYNVISFSPSVGSDEHWGFGYGFGTEPRLGGHGCLDVELTAEQVNEQEDWLDAVNIVNRLGVQYGYTVGRHLMLSAGPSLNLLVTDWSDPETGLSLSTIAPDDAFYDEEHGDVRLQGWLGFRVGVGVRF